MDLQEVLHPILIESACNCRICIRSMISVQSYPRLLLVDFKRTYSKYFFKNDDKNNTQ